MVCCSSEIILKRLGIALFFNSHFIQQLGPEILVCYVRLLFIPLHIITPRAINYLLQLVIIRHLHYKNIIITLLLSNYLLTSVTYDYT